MKRKRFLMRAFTAAAMVALAVWAVSAQVHLKRQTAEVRASQQQAVATLAEALDAMHVTLQKASYAASPEMLGRLAGQLQTQSVSAKAAAAAVAPELEVKNVARAVIPTAGGYEKFAWEVTCTDPDGQDVLVYIDVSTGQEDDILILLYADGGTLTK